MWSGGIEPPAGPDSCYAIHEYMEEQNSGGGAFAQAPILNCWKAQFNRSMRVLYGLVNCGRTTPALVRL